MTHLLSVFLLSNQKYWFIIKERSLYLGRFRCFYVIRAMAVSFTNIVLMNVVDAKNAELLTIKKRIPNRHKLANGAVLEVHLFASNYL